MPLQRRKKDLEVVEELPWVVDNTQGAVDGVAERRKVMAVDYRTRTGIARRRG